MRFEFNPASVISASIFVATLSLSSNSFGRQCSVTPPPGSIVETGCSSATVADLNAGCNAAVPVFTDLGTLASGGVLNVAGQFGTFIPAGGTTYTSRDLDWYLVQCDAGTLAVTLSTANAAGNGQMSASVIFIKATAGADPCLGDFDIGVQSSACPHLQSIVSGAGRHLIVVTTPFETDQAVPALQCGTYLMTLTHTPLSYPICGTSTESCTVAHGAGGCNIPECCEQVCSFNPLCCDIAWDSGCVDSGVTTCGLFIYACSPPASAPANDCATESQLIEIGQLNVVADNTNAGTDGPGPVVSACAAAMGKDLWYTIQVPTNGALTISTCVGGDASTDSVIELFGLGADPVVTSDRAGLLPDMYIGCVDDTCADATGTIIVGGPGALTLIDAVAGEYYLIRIGGWYDEAAGGQETADTFVLSIVTTFEEVMYTTGPQHAVVSAAGQLTNIGLSSGCTAALMPQRWLAQAFVVPSSAASWDISRMTVKGFAPAGVTNTTLNYVVWSRLAGNPRPLDGQQLFTGSVPYPVGYNGGADDFANASHDIAASFTLAAGNYYLTAYATNPSCGTVFSNFAWFVSAYDGINLIDASGPFAWRSSVFPGTAAQGFLRYTFNGAYIIAAGADPNDLYNTAFDIFGSPVDSTPPCPGDYNNDGIRNGADLSTLLSGWGTAAADITGDQMTDGQDLSTLLSGWGACPN